jgi:hypothetical protein
VPNFVSLLNLNRSFQRQVKHEIIYYSLSQFYSIQFYTNKEFRANILMQIQNPVRQIALKFFFVSLPPNFTLQNLKYVHSLTMQGVPEVSPPSLEITADSTVSFDPSKLNLSLLHNLKKIEITYCPYLTSLNGLDNVPDLNFSYCTNLFDISSLKNGYKLNLTGCYQVKDISNLKYFHSLGLRGCSGIKDFSPLGRQYYLDLSKLLYNRRHYIPMIKDVSHLKHVHTLILNGCDYVTDVSALDSVNTLNLGGCRNLKDISSLVHVTNLDISCCEEILSFDSLGRQKKLNLSDNYQLEQSSMPSFSNVRELILDACWNISDISCLTNVRKLSISDLPNLLVINVVLPALEEVKMFKCSNLINVSGLSQVKKLKLGRCIKLANISVLRNLQEFILSECYSITTLQGLEKNLTKLSLTGMDFITDLSILTNLKVLALNACSVEYGLSSLINLEIFRYVGTYYHSILDQMRYLYHFHTLKKWKIFEFSGEVVTSNSSSAFNSILQQWEFGQPNSLDNLKYFSLSYNYNIKTFSYFSNLIAIHLSNLFELESISFCSQIKFLELRSCPKVTEIHSLFHIYTLQIFDCANFSRLHHCSDLQIVSIVSCPLFQNFHSFIDRKEMIPHMRICISHCSSFDGNDILCCDEETRKIIRTTGTSSDAAQVWKSFPTAEKDFSI